MGLVDDAAWNAKLRGMHEFRDMVAESEKELDADYQRLRFRPDDDSLGGRLLEGHPAPMLALAPA
jgi:hypothetical protein